MNEVRILKATKKDLNKILSLFKNNPYSTENTNFEYKKNYILEYLTNSVSKVFIAEINNKVAGVILTQFLKKAKYVYYNELIVNKKYQKKGIGTLLHNYVENLAKKQKYKVGFLFTNINNEPMQKMAKKLNYKRGEKFYFFSKEF